MIGNAALHLWLCVETFFFFTESSTSALTFFALHPLNSFFFFFFHRTVETMCLWKMQGYFLRQMAFLWLKLVSSDQSTIFHICLAFYRTCGKQETRLIVAFLRKSNSSPLWKEMDQASSILSHKMPVKYVHCCGCSVTPVLYFSVLLTLI